MSAEAIIKKQARDTLKNNYVKAISGLLIILLPLYMIDGGTTVISCFLAKLITNEDILPVFVYGIGYPVELVAGFLLSPIINGYIRMYYRAAYSKKMDITDMYYYFSKSRYAAALRLNFSMIARMILPLILFYLPFAVFEIVSANSGDFYESVLYNDVSFIMAVLSTLAATLYALRYFTVYTVSVDVEQAGTKQIFAYSRYIMQNKTSDAAKLIFSFTPWFLLCLLILPMLYVIPYFTQSLCISAKWMTKATFEVN